MDRHRHHHHKTNRTFEWFASLESIKSQNYSVLRQHWDLFDNHHDCFVSRTKRCTCKLNTAKWLRNTCKLIPDACCLGYATNQLTSNSSSYAHVKHATLDLYYGADATQILEIKKNGFIDPQSRHISPRETESITACVVNVFIMTQPRILSRVQQMPVQNNLQLLLLNNWLI